MFVWPCSVVDGRKYLQMGQPERELVVSITACRYKQAHEHLSESEDKL